MSHYEFNAAFLFAGSGFGAHGFCEASAKLGPDTARFVNAGGIDLDPKACQDFEYLTGGRATIADLATMEPAQLLKAVGADCPWAFFLSSPCKGYSRLLSKKMSETPKYQALNRLALQGLFLILETWRTNKNGRRGIPGIIVFENVQGITTRGRELLDQIRQLLRTYGYVFHESTHDCGEIGGLAQHRPRYLLIARQQERVPAFVHRPPIQRVKACGEVLWPLPLPEDPAAGELHRLPRLSWLNWARLALIPAGGDWRDLPKSVTTQPLNPDAHQNKHAVIALDEPAQAVIGATRPGSGAPSVSDPRLSLEHSPNNGSFGVQDGLDPSKCVRGQANVRTSPAAIVDPRVSLGAREPRKGTFGVIGEESPAPAVTGSAEVASSNTPAAIQDTRVALGKTGANSNRFKGRPGLMGVGDPGKPAPSVTGTMEVSGGHGQAAIVDPRVQSPIKPGQTRHDVFGRHGVQDGDKPSGTVTGPGANADANVADPRLSVPLGSFHHAHRVYEDSGPVGTVTHSPAPSSGGGAVSDPRLVTSSWPGKHSSKYGVRSGTQVARIVTGDTDIQEGAPSIADTRLALGCSPRSGAYGVNDWEQPAGLISGAMDIDNRPAAVADPRDMQLPPGYVIMTLDEVLARATTPKTQPPKGMIPVILSPHDGYWHRPLTTLELAVLQSAPAIHRGQPLKLAGSAVSGWRERIGNAVPSDAAKAIGNSVLKALLAAALGTWSLSQDQIWTRDDGLTEYDFGPEPEQDWQEQRP